jgi:hypothetical protein
MKNIYNQIIFYSTSIILIALTIFVMFSVLTFYPIDGAESIGANATSILIAIGFIYLDYRLIKSSYNRLIKN